MCLVCLQQPSRVWLALLLCLLNGSFLFYFYGVIRTNFCCKKKPNNQVYSQEKKWKWLDSIIFLGWSCHSRFHSSATRGHILVALYTEKLGLSATVGPWSQDVIDFMKRSSEDVLYLYTHTHYAGRTDTFECFLWGEDEEDWNVTLTSCFAEGGGDLTVDLASVIPSGTFWKTQPRCSLSWKEITSYFFVCVYVCAICSWLWKRRRMYDSSQPLALCSIQLCLFISLYGGREVGRGVMERKEWIRKITTWQLCSQ